MKNTFRVFILIISLACAVTLQAQTKQPSQKGNKSNTQKSGNSKSTNKKQSKNPSMHEGNKVQNDSLRNIDKDKKHIENRKNGNFDSFTEPNDSIKKPNNLSRPVDRDTI
jgi:predicted methyltransferase